jgi:hypothetical protein
MYNSSDFLKLFIFYITVQLHFCVYVCVCVCVCVCDIDVIEPKELFPEVWQIPCETPCMLRCES